MKRHKAHSHGPKSMPADSSSVSMPAKMVVSVVFFALFSVAFALPACSNDAGENQSASDGAREEAVEPQQSEGESGEHGESGERGESGTEAGSEDGEESGVSLTLDQTFDTVRNGARLILNYDAGSNSFVGTVSNTTDGILRRVRVEVHLSNGTELGPTTPADLAPGEKMDVNVAATEAPFTGWTPHAEVDRADGGGEHGSGDGGGEHSEGGEEGGEGGGEHGGGEGRGEGGGERRGGGEGRGEHGGG